MPAAKKKLALKKSAKPTGASKKSGAKGKPAKPNASKNRTAAVARPKASKPAPKKSIAKKAAKAVNTAKKAVKSTARAAVKKAKAVVKSTKKAAARVAAPKAAAAKKVAQKLTPSPVVKAALKPASKIAAKVAPKPVVGKTVIAKGAPAVASRPPVSAPPKAAPKPVAVVKPRRPKLRIRPDTGPLAAWLPQPDGPRPRPSSFIPAPPRAENAFSVAAPPATSDRIVRPDDLAGLDHAIRTSPVRVDIEQSGGRTHVYAIPEALSIRAGDGVEWDFRYLGGADVIVEDVLIEFEKPSPFGKTSFRSSRPGNARPHRQISGVAAKDFAGKTIDYTIKCFDLVKNEVAKTKLKVTIN